MDIVLPYNYTPRDYQVPLWEYFENGGKRAAAVWHRRAGKDLNAVHLINTQAHKRVGTYWHLFPTYAQGKKIAWDGMTKDGKSFRSAFPKPLVAGTNNTEMKITLKNGSIYQVVGADKPDSLVGANPIGIVYSEWSLMNPNIRNYLRPILSENGGWELFIYTPRGSNHGKKTMERAKKDPKWFSQILTVEDTKAISLEAIQEDREDGMPEEIVQQEYWCSFEAPVVGSYYGKAIATLEKEGKITAVPWETRLPVHTAWDLGIGDSMTIWFYQQINDEIRIIDYYECSGEGLAFYIKHLREKPYVYGNHYAPHDIKVRELGTGKSRWETARSLGITFRIVEKQSIEDGIQAVRGLLPRCWFDEDKTENGLNALKEYHKEWDEINKVFKNTPHHDWSSHAADGFRMLALALKDPQRKKKDLPQKAEDSYDIFSQ